MAPSFALLLRSVSSIGVLALDTEWGRQPSPSSPSNNGWPSHTALSREPPPQRMPLFSLTDPETLRWQQRACCFEEQFRVMGGSPSVARGGPSVSRRLCLEAQVQ